MPNCETCGSHVSDTFERVFAPEGKDGVVNCPSCSTMREVQRQGTQSVGATYEGSDE